MGDNRDKPVLEFEITDLDSVWAPPDQQGNIRILFCTGQTHEVALKLPPAILAKLEVKLTKLREMQAQATGAGRH
jgi:hypothetical protein